MSHIHVSLNVFCIEILCMTAPWLSNLLVLEIVMRLFRKVHVVFLLGTNSFPLRSIAFRQMLFSRNNIWSQFFGSRLVQLE